MFELELFPDSVVPFVKFATTKVLSSMMSFDLVPSFTTNLPFLAGASLSGLPVILLKSVESRPAPVTGVLVLTWSAWY